jgi:hypothetical protein
VNAAIPPAELAEIALRVLTRWSQGREPDREDTQVLRECAPADETHLDIDELACRIVERTLLGPSGRGSRKPSMHVTDR